MDLDEASALLGSGLGGGGDGPAAPPAYLTDLVYDSRRVVPGALFFCLPGAHADGHDHAPQALAAGAAALVVERRLDLPAPQFLVPSARAAMNRLAAPFFGHPSRSLALAGVTGTNGKTTVTYMLEAIWRAAGHATGLIGTVETRASGLAPGGPPINLAGSPSGGRTTPQSVDLQRVLRQMVDRGVTACAMEVTSIGLEQGRVDGTEFSAAAFTNLTHDHLDYHGTLDAYFAAKRVLFTPAFLGGSPRGASLAWVNVDDPLGRVLADDLAQSPGVRRATYGVTQPAQLRSEGLETTGLGASRFVVVVDPGTLPWTNESLRIPVLLRLPGAFNVANALAAAGMALGLGVAPAAVAEGLESLGRVPGRFELVDEGQPFRVVVDYAHTPDALQRVLGAARGLARSGGAVIAVFGCGGDRDRGKRPLMGAAAAAGADRVIVTSDNPRGEDPLAIMADIEVGLRSEGPPGGYAMVVDRAEAIEAALVGAAPGDVVVIAGKGHEMTQTLGDQVVEFSDARVAASLLHRLAAESSPAAASAARHPRWR